jgi:cell division protein FtsN
MSSSIPPQVVIAFSPEMLMYFIIALVTATVGIILWVYKQTHPMDKRVSIVENNIDNLKKNSDEERPKFREMELLLARLTERLSARISSSINEGEERTKQNE